MAFKMNGFNKPTDPPKKKGLGPNSTTDGDEVSGRTKEQEIAHDIERLKKDISNPKYSPEIIKKFQKALKENQDELAKIRTK
tara:strand:- start:41 stop:286 length:246 start_codon:yes stop_codon:yes gene_type:complete